MGWARDASSAKTAPYHDLVSATQRRVFRPLRRPQRTLALWIAAATAVTLVGTVGYMLLEGWTFLDSLYMTVNTLATVGFREIEPMHPPGLIWTMALSVAAVVLIFGTVGVVAETMLADIASGRREERRMQKRIDLISGHVIVCGFGRVGAQVSEELRAAGQDVVVSDVDEESLGRAATAGFLFVHGDYTTDDVLHRAGIERARVLVSCIDNDANSVFVTLTARALNPDLFLIGRAGTASVVSKLRQAGANRAVSPYVMAGRRIIELALRPGVVDFIDQALSPGQPTFSMEELEIRPASPLIGRTVGDLRALGVFTLAIMTGPRAYAPSPPDDRALGAGMRLIVSGPSDQIGTLADAAQG